MLKDVVPDGSLKLSFCSTKCSTRWFISGHSWTTKAYVCVHNFVFPRWKVKIIEDSKRSRRDLSKSSGIKMF